MPRVKKFIIEESNFVKFQPNPSWKGKGRYKHEDCSIRSICAATGKTWEEVYDLLCECGKKVYDVPSSDDAIEEAMKRLGYKRVSVKAVKGSKRPTPSSLTKENPEKSFVMRVSCHSVGGKDGKYLDCWDCGDKGIYYYYEK